LPSTYSPKNTHLSRRQREEDLAYADFLASFKLQTFQALNGKSNPNQTIQNINQAMKEEDFSFPNPFFLQSANNPNPKQQKQPKTSISKCNCNSSSSITQQKNSYLKINDYGNF